MRVTVIGGGVAGSAAAIALRRIGAEVTVYEAYEDPAGPVGSYVSLAVNGLRALGALGCLAQVQAAGFPVARHRMWSGRGSCSAMWRGAAAPRTHCTVSRSCAPIWSARCAPPRWKRVPGSSPASGLTAKRSGGRPTLTWSSGPTASGR